MALCRLSADQPHTNRWTLLELGLSDQLQILRSVGHGIGNEVLAERGQFPAMASGQRQEIAVRHVVCTVRLEVRRIDECDQHVAKPLPLTRLPMRNI